MTKGIKGLGIDLIEVERIRQSIERHGQAFLDRLFSHNEQSYCLKFKDAAPHFAGRFAAKEAIAKALGTGFGKELSWLDIEVLDNENGKPVVGFSDEAQKRFHAPQVMVSISHTHTHATSVAMWT
ncbi:MAG: holo-ACP synthase [Verrucomicrobia bacterium]|nr:holo-ACP synthase [Verrucomicrobiota bacterium]MDE3046791.1 holo-ACP synthase [Verrucomicrobiota bacterium]